MAQPAGTIPVKNEKYVENICTHTLCTAKGRPGPLLNEGPITPVAREVTPRCVSFERGLRSARVCIPDGKAKAPGRGRKEERDVVTGVTRD